MAMQEKVSVYNNPMGGGQAPPPPKVLTRLPFERDGYTPQVLKLEDAIRMESNYKNQNDILTKYYKMLLSSIFPKWGTEANTPKAPREPIRRKERSEKNPIEKKFDFQIGKKIEDQSDKLLLSIGKGLLPVVKPPYKLALLGLDLLGKGLVKGDELLDKAILKGVIEPALFIYKKVMPPLDKIANAISQTIVLTIEVIEREAERVIEFLIAPLSEALETVQVILKKIYTPIKRAKNWLAKKMPAIPKPSLSLEPFDRVIIKPMKAFLNTFIAIPLAKAMQKAMEPLKQGSKFLTKKGSMAYLVASNFVRAVGSKVGKYLEAFFRRFGRFLVWLFRILKAAALRLGRFLLRFPQLLSKLVKKLYLASCRLTHWAASALSRN